MDSKDSFLENQKAIKYIIDNIKNGSLIVGSKIPSERDLAERIGIGRSSTREAISILRGMGLIESYHGSGNYIANNTESSIKQIVDIMIALGSISQRELLEYRTLISRTIGVLLIKNGMDPEDEHRLHRIIEAMRNASDEEFCKLDREFHLGLINATKNRLFITVMEPIGELYLDMIVNVIMDSTDEDRVRRIPLHENIFNSIRNKDLAEFEKCIREHYEYVESKLKWS